MKTRRDPPTGRPKYFLVTRKAPWQSACDKCRAVLTSPFCWTNRHSPYRTVCLMCGGKDAKSLLAHDLGVAMYGPGPLDPRYT